MLFSEALAVTTEPARQYLIAAPIIERALAGRIEPVEYVAFLTEAYHHVRHTVPLMMAAGARLPARLEWLRKEVVHYIEEELGHDQWILNDIEAAGGNAVAAQASTPSASTDAMVAYAYDTIMRRNPVGFFGMVFVLEGTSVALALRAADRIQKSLNLSPRAMTYLRSHGQLDQEHIQHLSGILNRLDDPGDRSAVEQCAQVMFRLYGNMFRDLEASKAPQSLRRIA